MKKYRTILKNNSWLSFDEETGEIKLPEHFGVDLMYNNDLSKEQIKIAHKRAEENDYIVKDIAQYEENDSKLAKYTIMELQDRINKAIEYLETGLSNYEEQEELLNILKGDNK